MANRKKEEPIKLVLRLPPDLHKALVVAAEMAVPKNSLNREIVTRLADSFAIDLEVSNLESLSEDDLLDRIVELVKRVRAKKSAASRKVWRSKKKS